MSTRARTLAFAALCVAQLVVAAGGIAAHERVLQRGTAVKLAVAPVDPADPFRGRYVSLAYAIERGVRGVKNELPPSGAPIAYAVLRVDDAGFGVIERVTAQPPASGLYVKLRGMPWEGPDGMMQLDLPFDRYYMEESLAPRAEDAYRRGAADESSYAVLRVLDGRAVIEGVFVDGKPIEQAATESRR
jgi:hypothetical protein